VISSPTGGIRNRLYYGDCLRIMQQLNHDSVDLIYLDPPFKSDRDYNSIYKDETGRPLPGIAKVNLEQYEEAIKDFDQAIKINPQNTSAYKTKAMAYDKLGFHIKALKDFFKGLRIENDDSEIIDLINTALNGIKENNNFLSLTLHAVFWYLINTAFIVFLYWVYECTNLLSNVEDPLLYFVIILIIWLLPIIYSVQISSRETDRKRYIQLLEKFGVSDLTKPLINGLNKSIPSDPIEGMVRPFNRTPNP